MFLLWCNATPQPRNPATPQPRNPATPQPRFNAVNRGVYIADNLDFLRAINTASVDLVCIDPPFAKNDTFTADKLKPALTRPEIANEKRLLKGWGIATAKEADAAGIAWPDDPRSRGGYKDTWSWDQDIHQDWVDGIKVTHPAVNMLIETSREIHGDSIAAYLAFMAIRLFELHRVLKPTGSLYLHCDHTASGYLRQLLDGVFGVGNFKNEIAWRRYRGKKAAKSPQRYANSADHILFYGKDAGETFFDLPFSPLRDEYVKSVYRYDDKDGKGPYRYGGRIRDRKYYLSQSRGVPATNWWDDIDELNGTKKEATGYPTQKPYLLAERIIKASCPENGVVLDCFAGCAYAAIAAERLGRNWTACDINPRAWTVFKRQFNKGGDLPLLTCNDRTTGQQVMGSEPTVTVHGPTELPRRTTTAEVEIKPLRTTAQRDKAARQYKRESTLMSREEMLDALLDYSRGRAWCCGYESRGSDGQLILRNYDLDHITPKSMGGEDEITNRAPMCGKHNGSKSNRPITLYRLREEIIYNRELAEGISPAQLVDLDAAVREARHIHSEAYQRKFGNRMNL